MITQVIRKQVFCVKDVRAIGNLNKRVLVCHWRLQEVPYGGGQITQNNSCQQALCNRCPVQFGYSFPSHENVHVTLWGPIVCWIY